MREWLAIIIPTKERPEELTRLLKTVTAQRRGGLIQVIVVDGGEAPAEKVLAGFPELAIDYVRSVPASLTAQRNAGIRALKREVTLAAFFDDDVVLEEGALEAMMRFWERASPDTGGAAFNLTNESYRRPTVFERLFVVNAVRPGMVLKSGFQSKVACVGTTISAQWLAGCAMVWRAKVFGEFLFDEAFSGYARYEEVDFSYRVGKKYRVFIVADACAKHLSRVEDIGFSFPLGKMEVVNRIYFVRKNPDLSVPLCVWALTGLTLNNVLKALVKIDRRCLRRALGNLAGFLAAMGNR